MTRDGEKACDVVVVVLNAGAQRYQPEERAGTLGRDRRRVATLFVAHHLCAARGVVGRNRLDVFEPAQERRTLGQRLGMRQDPANFLEAHSWQREQVVHDRHLHFADD